MASFSKTTIISDNKKDKPVYRIQITEGRYKGDTVTNKLYQQLVLGVRLMNGSLVYIESACIKKIQKIQAELEKFYTLDR